VAASFALLESIPAADRERLLGAARRRRFRTGEPVFHAGGDGDCLHLVEEGRFGVQRVSPDGRVVLLSVIGPGGFFGEMALLYGEQRSASVAALEPATTRTVTRSSFLALRERHPSLDRAMAMILAERVRQLDHQLLAALYTPVEVRVAARLLDAFEAGGRQLPLTQQQIAELAGTSRPTANQVLHSLVGAGLIRLGRGTVELVDPAGLRVRATPT
jgi:CRP/FNR family cyclic AMP-dependent transcriptional regulator